MSRVTDPTRLEALRETDLLDSPRDEAFDRLTRLACRLVGAPVALVSLVDADRQFFLAETGLAEPAAAAQETPLDQSFCRHVVERDGALVVPDALEDPLVADNEAVPVLGVRAYLGVPVYAPGGAVLGALCAIDTQPHAWTDADRAALADLADVARAEIAARVAGRAATAQLAAAESRAIADEALLRLAVEAAGFGVWSTDLKTGETFWGPRCREIYGVGPETVASEERGLSLVHPDDRAAAGAAFAVALEDPAGEYRLEKRMVHTGGAVRWVLNVGQVLRDGGGAPSRILGLSADVTDQKAMEMQLRERRETLERDVVARTRALQDQTEQARRLASALALAEQRERRRLAHVLHEDLQQILFGIGLFLQADRAGGAVQDPAIQDLVDRALRLTRSLSHELAAPDAFGGRLDLVLNWLAESVHDVQGLDIVVEAASPVFVSDDVQSVTVHLIREILFNVAKHAGVTEAVVRVGRDNGSAVIEVVDRGVGFDADRVERRGREGLGLRGVRDRVGLIGGGCDVESVPGQGTRVALRVPAEPSLLPARPHP